MAQLTIEEVSDKIRKAQQLILDVECWAHDRFTDANNDEKHDHCFGYNVGFMIGVLVPMRDTLSRVQGQLTHMRKIDTKN